MLGWLCFSQMDPVNREFSIYAYLDAWATGAGVLFELIGESNTAYPDTSPVLVNNIFTTALY